MDNITEKLLKLDNWTEIQPLHYRYVLAAGACYEILTTKNRGGKSDLDKENAEGLLFISSSWSSIGFTREILYEGSIDGCLKASVEDYNENMSSDDSDVSDINSEIVPDEDKCDSFSKVANSCKAMYMAD